MSTPAPVVHFELGFKDLAKAQKFYGGLFGWSFSPFGETTAMITNIGEMAKTSGIGGHLNALGHEPHNYCVVYVQVSSIETTVAQAQKMGAELVVPKMEVPQMGYFAWLKDPEGNMVGLWTPMAH